MRANYYLKIAWRGLKANRFYSLLNIAGLAIGLATGIMMLLWVQYSFSFDKFNHQYKQIYQLSATMSAQDGNSTWAEGPGGIVGLVKNMPAVLRTVRLQQWNDQNISTEDKSRIFDGNQIAYVDSGFLSMFDYTLLKGSKQSFLKNVNSVAITQQLANRLFDTEDVIGRKLLFFGSTFEITAVLKDFPKNSTLQYSALFPMSAYARRLSILDGIKNLHHIDEELSSFSFRTFFLLSPTASPETVAQSITKIFKQTSTDNFTFGLQPLASLHLTTPQGDTSDLRLVQILLLVAVLVLVVASINYVNLSTARSLIRLKEVSVRKIIGAQKWQLFVQFMAEALLLFAIAIAAAITLTFLLIPFLRNISGDDIRFTLDNPSTLLTVAVVTLATLVMSTVYPALLLSSFKPIIALKGVAAGFKITTLRKALVIIQFSVAFILFMSAIIMNRQMNFIQNKDLGYAKSYAFSSPMTNNMVGHIDALEAELMQSSFFQEVGVSNVYNFSSIEDRSIAIDWKGKPYDDKTAFATFSADKGFIKTMKFEFMEGGNFSGSAADSNKYILNETAVKRMNLKAPYIGQQIICNDLPGTIIGVVKDFNYQPLTKAIGPLIMDTKGFKNILYLRTTAANAQKAIKVAERLYKKYSGNAPFSYYFLDKSFEAQYRTQQTASLLFKIFSGIALFISCLGLFGMATYAAKVRTKEIGIRKVLGANVYSIVGLVSGSFLKLVLLAITLAIPITYILMNQWRSHFAYKAEMNSLIFLTGAITLLLIAFSTIAFIAYKAARANPVDALKAE